ncbi:histidine kinase [Roseateles chitinivorans]|uniref:Histidine kinase n=1 Tax=Roseateles chitinivorans TaxID=2917965 RepID=A0A2G9C6H4_9BURK|nr:histidine kinase [Roseateles chitinivorans]PIM52026.1 histidine kinase [Roseateles chitinivorans]
MTNASHREPDRPPVEAWQAQGLYPFSRDPETAVEVLERQLFDQAAWHLSRFHPVFRTLAPEAVALQFRLLRQAVECGPEELQKLLTEVLNLPAEDRQMMAELLKDVSLSSVIRESHVVTQRLQLLDGLETILFDKQLQPHVKERGELHRIVARNPWIFGDEFALSVDNRSLTEVLRKHLKMLGSDIQIAESIEGPDQRRSIIDLMFSRATRRYQPSTLEHLVVELKAPRVKISEEQINQINRYALRVARDERFRSVNVEWSFWLVGREIEKDAREIAEIERELHLPFNFSVRVRTWSQLIDENRSRLQFLQENLDYKASRQTGLKHLQRRYPDCLGEVVQSAHEPQGTYARGGS